MGDNLVVKVHYALVVEHISRRQGAIARWNLKKAGLGDEKFPMGKVPSQRTEIAYKADLGRRLSKTRESPILTESHTVDAVAME